MATIEIWIQLENHPWDVCPNWPVDRSEAEGAMPVGPQKQVLMRSPVSGKSRLATVRTPIAKDALLLRRYTAEWKAPDDRKVIRGISTRSIPPTPERWEQFPVRSLSATSVIRYKFIFVISTRVPRTFPRLGNQPVQESCCPQRRAPTVFMHTASRSLQDRKSVV